MKALWNSFVVAFAMFSKIPMPRADWSRDNMKYMMCFFPFVGTAVGILFAGVACIGNYFFFEPVFVAALMTAVPVLVTGGIHVDGLLDTADAMSSWQERERRLEILKDSRAGAFAVITACVYFLTLFGTYVQVQKNSAAVFVLALGFMVSRCLSGIGVVSLPKAKEDGTVADFSRNSRERTVRAVLLVYLAALLVGMVCIQPVYGIAAFGTAVLVFWYYRHMALKYFGGTTGDLAGFFVCLCECLMAVALAVVSTVVV